MHRRREKIYIVLVGLLGPVVKRAIYLWVPKNAKNVFTD
jgi:hypothetical protein